MTINCNFIENKNMSDQSQGSIIQPTAQNVSTKTKISKISFTMLIGYILAGLFLVGAIVAIIFYILKKYSGHATSCISGDDFAVCNSNGVCTCDCKKTCTSDNNVIYNTSQNICSVDTSKVCPSTINGNQTGLQWDQNNNMCELLKNFENINCPKNCTLGPLCPLGTYSTFENDSYEKQYDPRISQKEDGKCYGPDQLFESYDDLYDWCAPVNWLASQSSSSSKAFSYCQPAYACTSDSTNNTQVCTRVNPSKSECPVFVNDAACGGDKCSNSTCSLKSDVQHLTKQKVITNPTGEMAGHWHRAQDIWNNYTFTCDAGSYFYTFKKKDAVYETNWCGGSDICSQNSKQGTCVSKSDYKNYLCRWC